jgi:hypothetical protein
LAAGIIQRTFVAIIGSSKVPILLAVHIEVIGNNLIDYGFIMPDEVVSRHAGGLP